MGILSRSRAFGARVGDAVTGGAGTLRVFLSLRRHDPDQVQRVSAARSLSSSRSSPRNNVNVGRWRCVSTRRPETSFRTCAEAGGTRNDGNSAVHVRVDLAQSRRAKGRSYRQDENRAEKTDADLSEMRKAHAVRAGDTGHRCAAGIVDLRVPRLRRDDDGRKDDADKHGLALSQFHLCCLPRANASSQSFARSSSNTSAGSSGMVIQTPCANSLSSCAGAQPA